MNESEIGTLFYENYLQDYKLDKTNMNETSIENSLEHVISRHAKKHSLKSKSVMPGNDFEVTYEIRVKENDMSFMNNISSMEGVRSAIMLSYDAILRLNQRDKWCPEQGEQS
ncbi:hypothetical protein J2S09_002705 [Bacillus fengqiuensis]|nr:hypothetical protein [Bacillus fengqiuensis]